MNRKQNISYIITTHFLDLCKSLDKDTCIRNCYMKTNCINDDIKYTYKMKKGISSIRGGTKVLKDLEYPDEILRKAKHVIQEINM